jgi:plasmid replication initiation protein
MRSIKNSQNLAVSNKLVKGRYKLTKEEQNFIYLMISQIKKEDKDFYNYQIHIKDLENNELTQKNYQRYREFADTLMKKSLRIEDDKRILNTNWFSSLEYIKDTGYIYACFDPKLKPYFLELKQEFTQAKLPTLLQFNSKYSSRLYLLLKSEYDRQKNYKNNLFISYEVEYLHRNFEMPKSYIERYSKFKEMFLNTATDEINAKTELQIDYTELKTGRKITSINFCISKKDKTEEQLKQEILTTKTKSDFLPEGLHSKAIEVLCDEELDLTNHDIKNIFEHYKKEDVEDICIDLWNSWSNTKLISKQGFLRGKLKLLNKKKTENAEILFGFD